MTAEERFAALYEARYGAIRAYAARRVGAEDIDTACIWYRKEVLCLQRSVVTTCLLRKYGVPAQMVIGAQQVPFKAHAWVEVGQRVVNDKPYVVEMYGILSRC